MRSRRACPYVRPTAGELTVSADAEVKEVVSHVLALRKDFIQDLLKGAQVALAERDRPKAELRATLLELLSVRLTVERSSTSLMPMSIVIRGISDLIGDKGARDAEGWQPRAAAKAVVFALELLFRFQLPPSEKSANLAADA